MPVRFRPPLALAGLTLLLWVVPSIGSQGMGTIGQRFTHPDAVLFDTLPGARDAARTVLQQADAAAEAALGL